MEQMSQRKIEKELQKALAIAYVTPFCMEHNLSLEKLKSQRFNLSCNECAFAQPRDVKPNGLVNDRETMPKVTLIVRHENGQLLIEETEYTKAYLFNEIH
jgi:hypothetical protein